MRDRVIQRGALLGALAAAMLLAGACERELPEAGSDFEGRPNDAQEFEDYAEPDTAVEPGTGGAGEEADEDPSEAEEEQLER